MIDYQLVQRMKKVVIIGALAAALPAIAPAAVIFTNFGPSLSYDVTQGNPVGNDFAGDNAGEGDSFIMSSNAIFTSARVALSCVVGCPASESFVISLNADNADSPGASLESFIFPGATLGGLGNNNPLIMVTSVAHPSLNIGKRYWITITSTTSSAIAWNNNSTGDTHDQAVSSDGGATWFSPSGQTPGALEVDGIITPEPSAGLLAGAGMILAVFRKRLSGRKA
jgi:hypothetical protein